jgi:hypothetical protein
MNFNASWRMMACGKPGVDSEAIPIWLTPVTQCGAWRSDTFRHKFRGYAATSEASLGHSSRRSPALASSLSVTSLGSIDSHK